MKKSLLEIYALLVCLVALIVMMIYLQQAVYHAIRLTNKESPFRSFSSSMGPSYYASNLNFTQSWNKEKLLQFTDEQITRMRLDAKTDAEQSALYQKKERIIDSLIYVVVSATLFGVHWRIGKKGPKTVPNPVAQDQYQTKMSPLFQWLFREVVIGPREKLAV